MTKRMLKIVLSILVILLLVEGSLYFFQKYQESQNVESPELEMAREVLIDYRSSDPETVDFYGSIDEFEVVIEEIDKSLSEEGANEEALVKMSLAGALGIWDRERGSQLLKEVALNRNYSFKIRAQALNQIVSVQEFDFFNRNVPEESIFTGEFEYLLTESGGDVREAMRKLSEWSNELTPNNLATYALAKWYAEEMHLKPDLSDQERNKLKDQVDTHILSGDALLKRDEAILGPNAKGSAYELKARALNLSGAEKNLVRKTFISAILAFIDAEETEEFPYWKAGPQQTTIFQIIGASDLRLYSAAFRLKHFVDSPGETERVEIILRNVIDHLTTRPLRAPGQRNTRLVAMLIAARDSESADYPRLDFNQSDIQRISEVFPDFGTAVENLDILEWVEGYPPEYNMEARAREL